MEDKSSGGVIYRGIWVSREEIAIQGLRVGVGVGGGMISVLPVSFMWE